MSRLERLLRIAADRNRSADYAELRFRIKRPLREALQLRCAEDRISVPALIEALVRGFVNKHPAALAMVEQWIRDEGLEPKHPSGPTLTQREVAEVYERIAHAAVAEDP